MVYLEKYRFPGGKTRGIGMVKEMDPMTQFVAYERVRRLQQIFEKIPEKSRNQFKELFVDLKRWDIESTAESLHEFLFNHIQHCALLCKPSIRSRFPLHNVQLSCSGPGTGSRWYRKTPLPFPSTVSAGGLI